MTAWHERGGPFDIGHDVTILPTFYAGELAGINEGHLTSDGRSCGGWVAFAGTAWAQGFADDGVQITTWTVEQLDPLTISPSVLCRACGNHGFIRDGRWVPA